MWKPTNRAIKYLTEYRKQPLPFLWLLESVSATGAPLSQIEKEGHGGKINQTQKVRDTQYLIKVTQTITKTFGPIKTPAAVINMAAARKPHHTDVCTLLSSTHKHGYGAQ